MKLVMTMMVRDEADIIDPVIRFHLDQGVDTILVTDNGSVDGTVERLQEYEGSGRVVLRHEPRQIKDQFRVVTDMAREAYRVFGADWVINADADEFWVPVDRSLTLRDAFEHIPTAAGSFIVPVVNLIGPVALEGSGLDRLVWRDNRSDAELRSVGVRAQPTPNAVHVGSPDVDVAQGNHRVSIPSAGRPDPEYAIEVLHLPWRSWRQFEHKVEISGRAYESNPDLAPSPNHHGMKDYKRFTEGRLLPSYILRFPSPEQLDAGVSAGTFVRDDALTGFLAQAGPELRRLLAPEVPLTAEDEARHRSAGESFLTMERAFEDRIAVVQNAHDQAVAERDAARSEVESTREMLERTRELLAGVSLSYEHANRRLGQIRGFPPVRAVLSLRRVLGSVGRSRSQ